jgi:peroxiredoxin
MGNTKVFMVLALVMVVGGATATYYTTTVEPLTYKSKVVPTVSVAQSEIAGRDNKAPDFSITTTDGKTVKLSDFKGKGVIVNFWATWCPPCRAEIPDMVELQKAYGEKEFSFIGIAVNDKSDKVAAFVKDKAVNYPVGMDTEDIAMQYGKLTKEGKIQGIPTSFVINSKGEIVDYFVGISNKAGFEEAIKKVAAK